jgi:transposase
MRRRYNKAFKQQAIKLVTEEHYKPFEASQKLGIPHTTFDRWLASAGWRNDTIAEPLTEDPKVLALQLREANKHLRRLQMENEILKKATAYFASQNLSDSHSSTSTERNIP